LENSATTFSVSCFCKQQEKSSSNDFTKDILHTQDCCFWHLVIALTYILTYCLQGVAKESNTAETWISLNWLNVTLCNFPFLWSKMQVLCWQILWSEKTEKKQQLISKNLQFSFWYVLAEPYIIKILHQSV